jgi:hypothetical protein
MKTSTTAAQTITITVGASDMGEPTDTGRETAERFADYLRSELPGAVVSVGTVSSHDGIDAGEVQDLWDAFLRQS